MYTYKEYKISETFIFRFNKEINIIRDETLWDNFEDEYVSIMKNNNHGIFLVDDTVIVILELWGGNISNVIDDCLNEILWSIYTNRDETLLDGEIYDFYYYLKTLLNQPFEVGQTLYYEYDGEDSKRIGLVLEKNTIVERFGKYYTFDILCNGEIYKDQYIIEEMINS